MALAYSAIDADGHILEPLDLWHPSVMQFYSGPLIHFLSGVDTPLILSKL